MTLDRNIQNTNSLVFVTVRKIVREIGIPQSFVLHRVENHLRLKCFTKRRSHVHTDESCAARLMRSRLLLKQFPKSAVD